MAERRSRWLGICCGSGRPGSEGRGAASGRADNVVASSTIAAITASPPPFVDQICDKSRPPGLVIRAEARAVVAVEVFIEQQAVSPVRILLEFFGSAVDSGTSLSGGLGAAE